MSSKLLGSISRTGGIDCSEGSMKNSGGFVETHWRVYWTSRDGVGVSGGWSEGKGNVSETAILIASDWIERRK